MGITSLRRRHALAELAAEDERVPTELELEAQIAEDALTETTNAAEDERLMSEAEIAISATASRAMRKAK